MNIDTIDMDKFEILLYIEKVLDVEMIFYEFCELIFFISRKYFQFYNISLEEEQKPKKIDENRKNARKKTRKIKKDEEDKESISEVNLKSTKMIPQIDEKKNEDYYLIEIIKTKDKFIKEDIKYEGINKYFYQKLKAHTIIENLREQERLRKIEEERKERDRVRYMFERNALKEEDINIFKEENEENESEEGSDY